MDDKVLLRLAAACAMGAGLLRIVSAIVPYEPDSAPLETLYFIIDIGLLFGLFGLYMANRDRVGVLGFVGFVIAESGVALIVGPDPVAFGMNFYLLGVNVISVGIALLSTAFLLARGPIWPAALWLASIAVGAAGMALMLAWGFLVAGALFGAGFVLAGWSMWRQAQ